MVHKTEEEDKKRNDPPFFLLEDLAHFSSHGTEIRVNSVEERLQHAIILGVRLDPVDGREMLSLSKLLVQAPENLHNGKCGLGDWIGEVTTCYNKMHS